MKEGECEGGNEETVTLKTQEVNRESAVNEVEGEEDTIYLLSSSVDVNEGT